MATPLALTDWYSAKRAGQPPLISFHPSAFGVTFIRVSMNTATGVPFKQLSEMHPVHIAEP
jgi:hypothetical protein